MHREKPLHTPDITFTWMHVHGQETVHCHGLLPDFTLLLRSLHGEWLWWQSSGNTLLIKSEQRKGSRGMAGWQAPLFRGGVT